MPAQVSAPVDTTVARRLTSLADVSRALADVAAHERAAEAELSSLLAARVDTDRDLAGLADQLAEPLDALEADAGRLADAIASTASLSERVSRKVRQLDNAQSRVHETLAHITATLGRTEAVEGLRRAMDRGDFERAAAHVAEFRDLEARFVSVPAKADDRALADQAAAVAAARDKLRSVVHDRLEVASRAGDHPGVLRFLRLHKPLGLKDEGMKWFTTYLRKLVAGRAAEAYTVLLEAPTPTGADFVDALTELFKDIAAAVDQNAVVVADTFGRAAVLDVAVALHEECDAHGARLLQRYVQHRGLARLAQQAAAIHSPAKVEEYLDEVLVLYQRSEEYNQYVLAVMADAVAPDALGSAREAAFRSGAFNVAVRELVTYYINLEEYYLEQNVAKAVDLDEWEVGSPTSTVVDDVFYIVQKGAQRAVATGNVQCACAVLGRVVDLLTVNLKAALDGKWKAAALRLIQLLAATTEGGGDGDEAGQNAACLNNISAATTYTGKLRGLLEADAGEVFTVPTDADRVASVLADFNKAAADFDAMSRRAAEQLSNGLMPRIRPMMDQLASVGFELDDDDFAARELGDSWVQSLVFSLITCFQYLGGLLQPQLQEVLVDLTLEKVADRLEALLRLKRFNLLGGLQLDRDVRTLTTTLADATQQGTREKFARLSQIATLLSLEAVDEVAELYGGGTAAGVRWHLGDTQIREILSLRHDFAQADIAALAL